MPQTLSTTLTLSNLLTAVAALLAVLLLIWLAGRAARAGGLAGRPGQRLQLRAALALDGKRRLQLVACDGRELLLLTGGATELVVGWLPSHAAPEAPGAVMASAAGLERMP